MTDRPPAVRPPRLRDDAHRRGNGGPPLDEPQRDPSQRPRPRVMLATIAGMLGLFALFALGLWKLVELVARAM